jgi:hypothetical protein
MILLDLINDSLLKTSGLIDAESLMGSFGLPYRSAGTWSIDLG